jgi:exodeoxyribonuclease VIII
MTAAEKLSLAPPCRVQMTSEEYHANPAIGSSSIKELLVSPMHYKYAIDNPTEPTPAMRFGTAVHTAILEPETFQSRVVVEPKFEGTGSRAKKEEWRLLNEGKQIVTSDQMADLLLILKSLKGHDLARKLLSGGHAEQSYFDICPDTGLARKARADFLKDEHTIIDVKTTASAKPEDFAKSIANFGYHISAAYYLDVVGSVLNKKFDEFMIIAIESSAPYGISVHLLDEDAISAGRFLYKKALRTLKECKDKNIYPGYPEKILTTSLPPWAYPHEES